MKIVLFDGECGICSQSVEFIFAIDKKRVIYFAPLQSAVAKEKLIQKGIATPDPNTFYYIDAQNLYSKSTGVLRLFKDIGNGWQLLYILIVVPRFVRDFLYDRVAKNRHRFLKKSACNLPSQDLLDRLL